MSVVRADEGLREQILALEERRRRALIDVDLHELDTIFDDSLVHIHAPGLVHSKQELLEHIEARRSFIDVQRGDLDIRVVGDIAILVGELRNRMRTPDGGERLLEGVATQVLHRTDGGWRFIHFQLTPFTQH